MLDLNRRYEIIASDANGRKTRRRGASVLLINGCTGLSFAAKVQSGWWGNPAPTPSRVGLAGREEVKVQGQENWFPWDASHPCTEVRTLKSSAPTADEMVCATGIVFSSWGPWLLRLCVWSRASEPSPAQLHFIAETKENSWEWQWRKFNLWWRVVGS